MNSRTKLCAAVISAALCGGTAHCAYHDLHTPPERSSDFVKTTERGTLIKLPEYFTVRNQWLAAEKNLVVEDADHSYGEITTFLHRYTHHYRHKRKNGRFLSEATVRGIPGSNGGYEIAVQVNDDLVLGRVLELPVKGNSSSLVRYEIRASDGSLVAASKKIPRSSDQVDFTLQNGNESFTIRRVDDGIIRERWSIERFTPKIQETVDSRLVLFFVAYKQAMDEPVRE